MPRQSLHGRLYFLLLLTLSAAVCFGVSLMGWLQDWRLVLPPALLFAMLCLYIANRYFFGPVRKIVQTINDGISSFQDHDFSITISNEREDELGALINAYNKLAVTLRQERFQLFQRELLLDTMIQTSPLALLLTNMQGTVIYSNQAAKQLFCLPTLQGHKLSEICRTLPATLASATLQQQEGLFTLEQTEQQPHEIYHLSCRDFMLNSQRHTLYLYKRLTREILRQEVVTWKKVIRLISHELNNSLGPIVSLTSSGQRILTQQNHLEMLPDILSTIAQRAQRLHQFIEHYAQFARLPLPQKTEISWLVFIDHLQTLCEFSLHGNLPQQTACFDAAQMEQVLINLIKNAHESGSPNHEVRLHIEQSGKEVQISVLDRGPGIQTDRLQQVLMPFYSTKPSGTGLGLPLCREIVEAHGGRLRLSNRGDGGFIACCILPLH